MDDVAADPRRISTRLVVVTFAAIFVFLGFGYWFFLSESYMPAFSRLRVADAAGVAGKLAAKDIPYRLADGGATILVPASQVDPARLEIAGSDLALRGGVGFELFNKSDMGLTDFAQRINYQRALQGELERTIMMLGDVDTARVHLAMPERTLFRTDRNNAKAAVELLGKDGRSFDAARVAGIRRLVAAAVPDLAPGDVVLLDGDGKLLGAAIADDPVVDPGTEEKRAVASYYRARVRAAVEQALPGVRFDSHVLIETAPVSSGMPQVMPAAIKQADDVGRPALRDFGLRITIASSAPLNGEDRGLVERAVASAVGFDAALGDTLAFQVGLANTGASDSSREAPASTVAPGAAAAASAAERGADWRYAVATMLLLGIAWFLVRRRPGRALDDAARGRMIARLRESLAESDHSHAA